MAEAIRCVCDGCGHSIEAWSDGNPYYIDETGKKRYAYHPAHELLERCVGNDAPHLCLGCGAEFTVDSLSPTETCPKCQQTDIVETFELSGARCPYCKEGVFARDSEFFAIS
jgi:DNA-directed RNA polymerase subunit RPC12/RpoP